MILLVCQKCGQAMRVMGDLPEIEQLIESARSINSLACWVDDCAGQLDVLDRADPATISLAAQHSLTPVEMYSALTGFGLPTERECGPLAVQEAFRASPVKQVGCKLLAGTQRTIVHFIGRRLYLGSSAAGALVYRISDRRSLAAEVEHELEKGA
jgi:hypothetical protein